MTKPKPKPEPVEHPPPPPDAAIFDPTVRAQIAAIFRDQRRENAAAAARAEQDETTS